MSLTFFLKASANCCANEINFGQIRRDGLVSKGWRYENVDEIRAPKVDVFVYREGLLMSKGEHESLEIRMFHVQG